MFCLKCGKEIPAESVFCLYCGAKMPMLETQPAATSKIDFTQIIPSVKPSSKETGWEEESFALPPLLFAEEEEEPFAALSPTDPLSDAPCCTACGRLLPETSISELCITCLNNRSFVASALDDLSETQSILSTASIGVKKPAFQLDLDLDAEYPSAYAEPTLQAEPKKHPRRRLIILMLVLASISVAAFFSIPLLLSDGDPASGSAQVMSNLERKVTTYARDMTQKACVNPDSVSFHKDATLKEEGERWVVTETFDRTSKQGEFVTTTYIATLKMDSTQSAGYVAIKLQIDDTVMYDHS